MSLSGSSEVRLVLMPVMLRLYRSTSFEPFRCNLLGCVPFNVFYAICVVGKTFDVACDNASMSHLAQLSLGITLVFVNVRKNLSKSNKKKENSTRNSWFIFA